MTPPRFSPAPDLQGDSGATGQVTIGIQPAQIVNARKSRGGIMFVNLTANDIYIGFNGSVTITSGVLLLGGKGAWLFVETQSALWGVAAVAGALSYIEV